MEERTSLVRQDLTCTESSDGSPGKNTANETDKIEANTNSFFRWLLGYLAGVLMGLAYVASTACAQALGGLVPALQLNAFRFTLQLISTIPLTILRRPSIPKKKKELVFLGLISLIPSLDNLLYYESTIYIPVGAVGALEATLMILFAACVAVVLRENLNPKIFSVSASLAVIGIICLAQPAFLFKFFGHVSETYTTPVCVRPRERKTQVFHDTPAVSVLWNTTNNNTSELNETTTAEQTIIENPVKGYLLVVGACLGYFANGQIFYRFLPDTSLALTMFCISVFGTVFSIIATFVFETQTFPASFQCVPILFGHSITAVFGCHLFVFTASRVSPVTFSLLNCLKLVFFLVAQFTVLKHVNPGHGNLTEIAGGILVLCATALDPLLTIYKQWKSKTEQE